jgi:plasmid stabilization system protein ParE
MKRSRRPLIRRIVRWLLAAEAVEVAVEAAERLAGREAPCADAKGRGTVKQLFGPKATAVFRASLAGAVLALVVVLVVIDLAPRMPFVTGVNSFIRQDVPFSHEHHAGEIGIDCRFCHQSAARSSFAGIPPTRTCMKCHRVLFADAPMLAPVRDSFRSGRPLAAAPRT